MEAQLQRPTHGHHFYEDDPHDQGGLHSVVEGGSHHEAGEKKSVIKKVKEKAKKIKDTIKKHSHGHEHEEGHEYRHDQISEEEDDDDDEEEILMHAPQTHGAPVAYESPVIPGTELPIQTDLNLEKPAGGTREDYFINPKVKNEVHHYARDEAGAPAMPFPDPAREPEKELHQIISPPDVVDKKEANVAEPAVMIGSLMGLEEDPHSPKNIRIPSSNYQSKVADPNTGRGGKEADVAPLVQRLDNIHIHDDQSKPAAASEQSSYTENPELPRGTIGEKISSATSVIADKAVSAKNVVASKLGYGGEAKEGGVDSSKKPVTELATEYGHRVAETLAPVYERVAGAGSAVLSKVQGGGGDTVVQGAADDKGVSVKQYLAEKFKPGEEDKALSEAIADAFHKREEVVMKTEEDRPIGVAVMPEEAVVERVISDRKEVVPPGGSDQTGVVNRLKGTVKMWIGGKSAAEEHPSGGGYGEELGR